MARALTERGHDVIFVGRREMISRVEAAGFPTRELTQAYTLLDRFSFHPLARIFGYLSSPAAGDELLSIVRAEAPDAVAIDAMFGAALDVAPRFGAPSAVMVHTFVRRMFAAWRGNLNMQSESRVRAGFAAIAPIEELWGGRDLVHSNSLADFDLPTESPLKNLRHGAPVLEQEPRAVPVTLPWAENDPTPLVLLSFSTVTEQRSPEKLQRALDALEALPVHVVATTGDIVDPALLSPPVNAVVLRFASHDLLLPRARFVVTHGGHGTAMRCLRAGRPMVCIPGLAADQPFVGAMVQEFGAGRTLPGDASMEDMHAAALAVLEGPAYAAAAARLSKQLVGTDGAAEAADAVESLLPAATRARAMADAAG